MPQNKLVLSYPLSTVGQRAKYEINMYEMSKNPNCPNWNWCRDLYHLFNDSKIVCELILTFLINLLTSFKSFTLTFSLCPTALYTTVPQGAHGDYLQTVPLPFGQHMSIFIKVLHVPCYEVDGTRCRHSLKTHHLDKEILETMVRATEKLASGVYGIVMHYTWWSSLSSSSLLYGRRALVPSLGLAMPDSW